MKQGSESPDELLDLVGLETARDRQTSQYSTGMKQRLEMAIAIVDEPELLVLDEPFTGLDPHGVKLVREIIEHENERGATVLISSHQLDQVGQLCDRVGILSDGNLVTSGTIDELCAESSLTAKIRVVLSDALENITLDRVNGIHEVIDRGSELHVTVDSGTREESVVEAVRNKNHRVTSVTIERPSMEELFVDLT
jgi:ABC-2 type transport system ATP-binding protein